MGNEGKEILLPYFRALEGKATAENERQGVGRVAHGQPPRVWSSCTENGEKVRRRDSHVSPSGVWTSGEGGGPKAPKGQCWWGGVLHVCPWAGPDFQCVCVCVCVCMCVCCRFSHVRLFATPWTAAGQVPLSMEFSRQEYWSGLPFPSPGDLPHPGMEPRSPAQQANSLPSETLGKLLVHIT